MASVAFHSVNAFAIGPAFHVLNVHVAVVTLQRRIARRMAILAARRNKNSPGAIERGLRCGGIRFGGAAVRASRGQNGMD